MNPDFGLTEDQGSVVGAVRRFVADRVAPQAADHEERKEFPRDLFRGLCDLGLGGIPYQDRYGGGGQGYLTYLAVLEEVAAGSLSLAVGLSVHHLSAFGIHEFGSESLKEKYLPKLFSGEWLGAYALSEAASGSDAAALRTRAERDGDAWKLTGTKRFISHGGEADYYLVMARTGDASPSGISAFAVEKGWPGFEFGKLEAKMGWHASPMRELLFDGCQVPGENLVGEEGEGFPVALAALDAGRLGIAACSVGLGRAALDAAVAFTRERTQFGRPVIEFQGLQFLLADAATQIEAARASPTEQAAIPSRPASRAARATVNPWPSSPTRLSPGTRHPSNRSSRIGEACHPILASSFPNSNPGQPFSTANAEMPLGEVSPVRAM
ncbi:MAG TPA: acyl-CoA dehydrogenase family protein, partial [Actinomycetota bacterium]|nr:acyl-CoA dehydrogenase family protein [Actinomycetota bacterium]